MERLGVVDAGFFCMEDAHVALHIGSVTVFAGPPPQFAAFVDTVSRRLPELPRYRMKMRRVPLGLARPVWIDDVAFDIGHHLRRTAVPAPGEGMQLNALVDRLMSTPLDHDRPMWEAWFVEGLQDGQWAVVWKIHHSMVDGVGGMALMTTMLDAADDSLAPPAEPWHARPEPSTTAVVFHALREQSQVAVSAVRETGALVRRPASTVRTVGRLAQGLSRFARASRPVSATSLMGTLDRPRHFTWTSVDFADVTEVRHALGGSVNDVVLTLVTRGLRDLLQSRGDFPTKHSVRCLVPVSVRDPHEASGKDNKISALLADLPVHLEHTSQMYAAVVAHTHELKSSHEAAAGKAAVSIADRMPPRLMSGVLQAAFRLPQRFVSTVVTNVPGPRWPLYLLGRRMVAIYPYVPIADRLRVGVAVTSYDGRLFFGITTDRDSVPDVGALTSGIATALDDLRIESAQAATAASNR